MNNSILVVGYGQGIGENLFRGLDGFDHKIAVSRSRLIDGAFTQHIQCDTREFRKHAPAIEEKVSLVVYVASEFGESRKVTLEEYDSFMNTGPRGLLNVFQILVDTEKLSENALFISIGSIASEGAHRPSNPNPVYAIAKSAQKSLVAQLAGAHKSYRFATITLGSIQNGDKGVGYDNITETIRFLHQITPSVRYSEIELKSEIDI